MAYAEYKVFIDWDNDQGTFLSDFETTLNDWEAGGGILPELDRVNSPVYSGNWSMEIVWPSFNPFQFDVAGRGFSDGRFGPDTAEGPDLELSHAYRTISNFIVGREYTVSARVWTPSGDPVVVFSVDGLDSVTSTQFDTWEELTLSFIATETTHTLVFMPEEEPISGGTTYVDYVLRLGEDEDVTDRVLASRTPIDFVYGRDQIRSLTAMAPGQLNLEVDNQSQDYSPDNPNSPVAGFLGPGREVFVSATFGGTTYNLFRGYLDNYDILPGPLQRSVKFSVLDMFAKLEAVKLSTEVVPSMQTGEALHRILDYIGWPQDARDIDPGATTVRWWSEEGTTGLDAVEKIVRSEGLPALAYVNAFNVFVFRDRHHRLLNPRSLNVQSTLDGENGPEPQISEPFNYNIGWSDLFNTVDVTVEELMPADVSVVWEDSSEYSLVGGEVFSINLALSTPVINAIDPVAGVDFTALVGSPVITLSRTSGQSINLTITAVGGPAVITDIQVRANPIQSARSYRLVYSDPGSVDQHGERVYNDDMPWANKNDIRDLAEIILGQRAERLPVIQLSLNNGEDERLIEMLERQLSDRVHIIEPETFTDDDYYVEQIHHTISEAGQYHTATFGCERIRNQVENVFTFDDPDRGFDDGVFGLAGLNDPSTILVLGETNLGEGFLGY